MLTPLFYKLSMYYLNLIVFVWYGFDVVIGLFGYPEAFYIFGLFFVIDLEGLNPAEWSDNDFYFYMF